MADSVLYQCPGCGANAPDSLANGQTFTCISCFRSFTLFADPESDVAGFVERNARDVSHPLFLPQGSVRALVTIATAVACWVLVFRGRDIPEYCLGLLLAILASYFAFRKGSEDGESPFLEATENRELPLFLPRGVIRWFLLLGFVASGVVLLLQKQMAERKYIEFFAVLGSLLAGYGVGKLVHRHRGGLLHALVGHVLASAVIGAAGYLAYLLVTDAHLGLEALPIILASAISFYFGSR